MKAPYHITEKEVYLALFADAYNERRVGEASVWYLYSCKAAAEIKEFNPNVDIIIMLRNSVDMIYSLHSQEVYRGFEDITNFEAALEAEKDRKRYIRLPRTSCRMMVDRLFYREIAKYSSEIEKIF